VLRPADPKVPAPDINFQDGYRDDQGPDDSSVDGDAAAADPAVASPARRASAG
jgi:hypothetical protein